jgi:ABC-type dipeptide/oligopeptide/nickel transport system permease component
VVFAILFSVGVVIVLALVDAAVGAIRRRSQPDAVKPTRPIGRIFVIGFASWLVIFIVTTKVLDVSTFSSLFVPNRWFAGPGTSYVPLFVNPVENLRCLTLGALAVGIPSIAGHYRFLRGDMIYNLQEDFVLMARSKGLTNARILTRHVFRPSSVTLVASTALTISGLIAGSLVVEVYLAIPGVGQNLISSISQSDYVAIQAIVLVIAAATVVVNFVADFMLTVIDPRIPRD